EPVPHLRRDRPRPSPAHRAGDPPPPRHPPPRTEPHHMNTGPWQYRTEHTTATKNARVIQRMTRKGREDVEETKDPNLALRPTPTPASHRGTGQRHASGPLHSAHHTRAVGLRRGDAKPDRRAAPPARAPLRAPGIAEAPHRPEGAARGIGKCQPTRWVIGPP